MKIRYAKQKLPQELNPNEIKKILRKIVQSYRIRLMLLIRRSKLLESVKYDFNKLNENFYSTLWIYLQKEEKVLEIIRIEEEFAESNIAYAIGVVNYLITQLEQNKDAVRKVSNQKVWMDVYNLLNQTLKLLETLDKDTELIEKRMDKERKLIEKANPDLFDEFLQAWQEEVKNNLKALEHFQIMNLADNNKIRALKTALKSGMVGGGLAIPGIPIAIKFGGLVSALTICFFFSYTILNFLLMMDRLYRKEFFRDRKDYALIIKTRRKYRKLKRKLKRKGFNL